MVISNCVINLAADKSKVLAEAARVLRPGGRFAVSDVIADPDMDDATRSDMEQWTGCVAGALTRTEFEETLADVGLTEIEIHETHRGARARQLGDHTSAQTGVAAPPAARSGSSRPSWGSSQEAGPGVASDAGVSLSGPAQLDRGHRRQGGRPMTTKADFSEEEWATLVRSPMVAGAAITLADPGGPIEVLKETSAVLKFVTSTSSEQRDDLVGELARELRGLAEQRQNPLGDFKPRGALAGKEIVDEISRADQIVSAKASPEEADAFRAWIMECAQRAADAAKEGGFMGFRAERVSQGEKDMLAQLRSALGVSGAP